MSEQGAVVVSPVDPEYAADMWFVTIPNNDGKDDDHKQSDLSFVVTTEARQRLLTALAQAAGLRVVDAARLVTVLEEAYRTGWNDRSLGMPYSRVDTAAALAQRLTAQEGQ